MVLTPVLATQAAVRSGNPVVSQNAIDKTPCGLESSDSFASTDSLASNVAADKSSCHDKQTQCLAQLILKDLEANRKVLDPAHEELGSIAVKKQAQLQSLNPLEKWVYLNRRAHGIESLVAKIAACILALFRDNLEQLDALEDIYSDLKIKCRELLDTKQAILVCQSALLNGKAKGRRDLLAFAPQWMLNCRPIAIKLAESSGSTLAYMGKACCLDKEIVMAAVKNQGAALRLASPSMRLDREIALAAAQCDQVLPNVKGEVLKCLSSEMRSDRELVLAAVSRDGACLQYASPLLREDRELVKMAVSARNSTDAFLAISKSLQEDKEIALTAVKRLPSLFQHLSDDLKEDVDIQQAAASYIHCHKTVKQFSPVIASPLLFPIH